jgi:hypothetical protein
MARWLMIFVLLAGCRGDDADSAGNIGEDDPNWNDPYPDAREDCINRINEFRATLDLPPLERWQEAEQCSDREAESDAATGNDHGAFGACDEWAQNECPAWDSIESVIDGCLQMMWDEGPGEDRNAHGHFLNMSSTDYGRVACGFHETADGEVWSVQNFR